MSRALELVWRSGPRLVVAVVILEVVLSLSLVTQLLSGRVVLERLGPVIEQGGSLRDLGPALVLLVVTTVLMAAIGAVLSLNRKLLGELTERHAVGEILEVTVRSTSRSSRTRVSTTCCGERWTTPRTAPGRWPTA